MATELKLRRDVEGDIDAMTPAEAEPIYDITNKRLRVGDGSTAGGLHLAAAADLTKQTFVYAAASGTDTLTLTLDPAIASYTTGLKCAFSAANNNTGAVTIAINGLGAKTIKKNAGASDLVADDLISGVIYEIVYDGVNFQLTAGVGGGLASVQVFTSDGTYTKTAGLTRAVVQVVASGGGGGGVNTTSGASAAGGGAGGTSIELLEASGIGATETVTIGVGGTAGSTAGGNGGAGNTSSFGALLSATGGGGGGGSTSAAVAVIGASGGTGSGGDVNIDGGGGSPGAGGTDTGSGNGGSSTHGGGGAGIVGGSAGNVGGVYGGGASGAHSNGTGSLGGVGGAGIVIVWEYF